MMKKMFYLLRALQIIGLIAICSVIVFQLSTLQSTANELKYKQTKKFAASITNLAAAESTRYLINDKHEDLQLLIDNLSHDPIVRDATIYNELGQVSYHSENVIPLENVLKINDNILSINGVEPYVVELYKEDNKIGYIRITIEQKKILSLIENYEEKGVSTMLLLLTLAFVGGLILMALFFRRLETAYYYLMKALCRLFIKIKSGMGFYSSSTSSETKKP